MLRQSASASSACKQTKSAPSQRRICVQPAQRAACVVRAQQSEGADLSGRAFLASAAASLVLAFSATSDVQPAVASVTPTYQVADGSILDSLAGIFNGAKSDVSGAVQGAAQDAGGALKGAQQDAGGALRGAKSEAGGALKGVKNDAADAVDDIKQGAKSVANNGLFGALKGARDEAQSEIKGVKAEIDQDLKKSTYDVLSPLRGVKSPNPESATPSQALPPAVTNSTVAPTDMPEKQAAQTEKYNAEAIAPNGDAEKDAPATLGDALADLAGLPAPTTGPTSR